MALTMLAPDSPLLPPDEEPPADSAKTHHHNGRVVLTVSEGSVDGDGREGDSIEEVVHTADFSEGELQGLLALLAQARGIGRQPHHDGLLAAPQTQRVGGGR